MNSLYFTNADRYTPAQFEAKSLTIKWDFQIRTNEFALAVCRAKATSIWKNNLIYFRSFLFCKSWVGQRIEPSASYQRLARLTFVNTFNSYRKFEHSLQFRVLNLKSGGIIFSVDVSIQYYQRSNFQTIQMTFTYRTTASDLEFIQTPPGFQFMQRAHKPSV